jgi:hypothetical protein
MYKITLLFESNEKGIYSKEEETASDKNYMQMKIERMLKRWVINLGPPIPEVIISDEIEDRNTLRLLLIKKYVKLLNNDDKGIRTFKLTTEEIQNEDKDDEEML